MEKDKKIINNLEKIEGNLGKAERKLGNYQKEISFDKQGIILVKKFLEDVSQQEVLPLKIEDSLYIVTQDLYERSGGFVKKIEKNDIKNMVFGVSGLTDTTSTIALSGTPIAITAKILPESYSKLTKFVKQRSQSDEISKKLNAIDPNLGDSYNNAWDNLYTPKKDNGRVSLLLMREVVRRIYNYLAPNGQVKKFCNANGIKLDDGKIKRDHRVKYIASKIDNLEERKLFLSVEESYDYIYNILCYAHKSGALNFEKAEGSMYQAEDLIKRTLNLKLKIL